MRTTPSRSRRRAFTSPQSTTVDMARTQPDTAARGRFAASGTSRPRSRASRGSNPRSATSTTARSTVQTLDTPVARPRRSAPSTWRSRRARRCHPTPPRCLRSRACRHHRNGIARRHPMAEGCSAARGSIRGGRGLPSSNRGTTLRGHEHCARTHTGTWAGRGRATSTGVAGMPPSARARGAALPTCRGRAA